MPRGRPKLTEEQKEARRQAKLNPVVDETKAILEKIAKANQAIAQQQATTFTQERVVTNPDALEEVSKPTEPQKERTIAEINEIMAAAYTKMKAQNAPPQEYVEELPGQDREILHMVPPAPYNIGEPEETGELDFVAKDRKGWRPL